MLSFVTSRAIRAGDLGVRLSNRNLPPMAAVLSAARCRRAALSGSFFAAFILSALVSAPTSADTLEYSYDALGRLIQVDRSDGTQTFYTMDAAGNRTDVKEGTGPTVPPSITVPSSSSNGSYTITWTASSGTVTAYELYESEYSNFSSQSRVYRGSATTWQASGKGNKTYYYRVRACWATCTEYVEGANGVTVAFPPSTPGALTVPSTNNTGSYLISWGPSTTGIVTAYELYESTASNFSSQSRIYNSTGTSTSVSRSDAVYYYRARACNGSSCSSYTAVSSVHVALRPGFPGAMSIPATSNTGAYTVSWGPPSVGNVTHYNLSQATTSGFTDASIIYTGPATSYYVPGNGNGNYWYRVQACNAVSCSGVTNGPNHVAVRLPPGAPSSVTVPATSDNGIYVVSWGSASGQVTTYELWEANNASFSNATLVVSSNINQYQRHRTTVPDTYYYRVRACNSGNCGPFAAGSNPVVINLITIPAAVAKSTLNAWPPAMCTWKASWGESSGATYYLFQDQSGYVSTSTTVREHEYSYCGLPNYSGNSMDYRPKWVKACNTGGCSVATNFY